MRVHNIHRLEHYREDIGGNQCNEQDIEYHAMPVTGYCEIKYFVQASAALFHTRSPDPSPSLVWKLLHHT